MTSELDLYQEPAQLDLTDRFVPRKALIFAVETEFAIPRPGLTTSPIEMYIGESRRYCPGLKGQDVLRGIPLEFEKLVPDFARKLATSPDSHNWEKVVQEFWTNYTINIPYATIKQERGKTEVKIDGGKIINASYRIQGGKIYPAVFDEYVIYELLTKEDPTKVSNDPSRYLAPGALAFFCVDDSRETERKDKAAKDSENIILELAKLYTTAENENTLRFIVSIVSKEVSAIQAMSLSKKDAMEEIKTLASDEPEKFLAIVKDKDLLYKALVKQLVEASLLGKQGDTYYLNDEPIGVMKQAVLFLKNPDANKTVETLRRKLDTYRTLI